MLRNPRRNVRCPLTSACIRGPTAPSRFASPAISTTSATATCPSHLIDTGDGLILIDTAYPQTVYLLLESIRRLGFGPADIRYLLNCHAHYDHCGGTRGKNGKYPLGTLYRKVDQRLAELARLAVDTKTCK